MELLQKETLITKSASGEIILTNQKIRYQYKENLKSIMLNQISGITVRYQNFPFLIVLAVIAAVVAYWGLNETDGTMTVGGTVAAIILTILYFTSRKHTISISSSSLNITFHTSGMSKEDVMKFIDQIEGAIIDNKGAI